MCVGVCRAARSYLEAVDVVSRCPEDVPVVALAVDLVFSKKKVSSSLGVGLVLSVAAVALS